MTNHSPTVFLFILLIILFGRCNSGDNTATESSAQQTEQSTPVIIDDAMIARAKAGNGDNNPDWNFLAKKLEDLRNEINGVGINEKNIQNKQLTALHYAVMLGGDLSIMLALLNKRADLNLGEELDLTPLHMTIYFDNKAAATLLIERGANKDAQDNYGRTPLHIAVWLNKPVLAKLLIEAGANKTIKDKDLYTPIQVANFMNQDRSRDEIIALLNK